MRRSTDGRNGATLGEKNMLLVKIGEYFTVEEFHIKRHENSYDFGVTIKQKIKIVSTSWKFGYYVFLRSYRLYYCMSAALNRNVSASESEA